MMVSNHFDVRWVDGYSAVSDVPSSLAAMIEKMAADLPSSHDRIELAVRDVRRPDGTVVWVGLLRFVVAVSSAPRPLGFLHAAVIPGGYGLDLDGWRALVARRYGGHPEERIRALYEELAESTRDSGRDRLHALSIRPEDVRELLEPIDETERTPVGAKLSPRPPTNRPPTNKPPSRPPGSRASSPALAAGPGPRPRPSQPALSMSVRPASVPGPPEEPAEVDDLPDDADLPTDITQPMEAPSGTAAPLSGEHPKQVRPVKPPQRSWWVAAAAIGALALLLGAVGWLAHRHRVLVDKHHRMEEREERWDRERKRLEDELAKAKQLNDDACKKHVDDVAECKVTLQKTREEGLTQSDQYERALDKANSELADTNNRLTAATRSREEAELRYRTMIEEQRRTASVRDQLEALNKELQADLDRRAKQLKVLCEGLQSARKHPKECQGIK